MENIDILNQRFGDALGRPDGVQPRFAWHWDRGVLMNSYKWFICQLMPNPFTPEQWESIHEGRRPYPGKLRWVQHPETALPLGVDPTGEHTSFYIRTLGDQMDAADRALKDAEAGRVDDATITAEAEAQALVDDTAEQFDEQVADWEPLGWKLGDPHEPGDHDGPVAYQVGGSRDEPIVAPV